MASTEVEMRAFERAEVCCPADMFFSGANEAEHVFVTDLSEGGVFAQTRQKRRRGERITLRLKLDATEIAALPCEVAWVRPFDPISVDGKMAGLGLRFRDLDPADHAQIRQYVAAVQKKPVPQAARAKVEASAPVAYDPAAWQDTLVDEPSASLPPEGSLSLGYEPALGELDLSQLSQAQPSFLPKLQRSWTPWLAAGSLLMGIAAGAVYGLMAPGGSAPPAIVEQRQSLQAPVLAEANVAEAAAPANAKKPRVAAIPADLGSATATPASKKIAVSRRQNAVSQGRAKANKPHAAPAKASAYNAGQGTALSGVLSGPHSTGQGWYVSITGGAKALRSFTLDGPPRAVVDLAPTKNSSVASQNIGRGPFKSLRVGSGADKLRLVFDLDPAVRTSRVRFTQKAGKLLIEIPREAMAAR